MKEVVENILKAEEACRQKIERARQESQEMIRKAQKDAEVLIEQAAFEAQAAALARKDQVQQSSIREKEEELKLVLDEISAKRIEKEKNIPAVSQRIFQGIIQIKE